jgi:hypothetical protein
MERMYGAEIEITAAQLTQLRALMHALAAEGGHDLTRSYDTGDRDLAADYAIQDMPDLLHRAEEAASRNPDVDFLSDPEILLYTRPLFGLSVFV